MVEHKVFSIIYPLSILLQVWCTIPYSRSRMKLDLVSALIPSYVSVWMKRSCRSPTHNGSMLKYCLPFLPSFPYLLSFIDLLLHRFQTMLGFNSSSILIAALILIHKGALAAPIESDSHLSNSADTHASQDRWGFFDAPSTPKSAESHIDFAKIAKAPFVDLTGDRLQPMTPSDFVHPDTTNSFASKNVLPLEEQLLSADELMDDGKVPSSESGASKKMTKAEKAKALKVKKQIAKAAKKAARSQAKAQSVPHIVGKELSLQEAPSLKLMPDLPSSAIGEAGVLKRQRMPGRGRISEEGLKKLVNAIKF